MSTAGRVGLTHPTPDVTARFVVLDKAATVESTVPSGHHTWAELLRLVGAVRRLAFDRTLPPSEALVRIRDAYHDYDHQEAISEL
jgi:hypothetical protein